MDCCCFDKTIAKSLTGYGVLRRRKLHTVPLFLPIDMAHGESVLLDDEKEHLDYRRHAMTQMSYGAIVVPVDRSNLELTCLVYDILKHFGDMTASDLYQFHPVIYQGFDFQRNFCGCTPRYNNVT